MTDQILFDRLVYIDRLKKAGVSEDQARAHADALDEALRETVVTKSELERQVSRIERRFDSVENKIELGIRDVTIRLGAIIAPGVAVLAALKYFG